MRVASLFSGGKDSTFATYLAMQNGFDVVYLISILPKNKESYMFHFPNIGLTKLQAKAMNIPIIQKKTSGGKEKEIDDLRDILAMKKEKIEGVVSGAIESDYQKTRIDGVCEALGLRSFAPLWRKNQEDLLREEINAGFDVIITGCFAAGLTKNWLGKKIDEECIKELVKLKNKFGINICGEGGEIETFVLDCPLFKKRIEIKKGVVEWCENHGIYQIKKAILVEK
ncbi:MAG: TIGR00289 family protein [Candidatus Parvarchaeota archaeon]|nr:TIGR00289 family protein [Candidatus Jingweiarchaeum tengchongense]MCW1298330.1 TIGR00289 family protein [Candidatus Jingweiarchaeum tengchongense]MCW1300420.1 TIGR00289 family protein [Candidatus Jingweiarchaeum tengchongense]MCW1310567.1 TIGR00289 family protein [Candidatus Jingweiarchaeum tengchongense]